MIGLVRRTIPIVIATTGLVVGVKSGGKVVDVVKDMVRAVMTRTEMTHVARTLGSTETTGTISDMYRRSSAWNEFLRQTLESRDGRDTSNDLWGQPFELFKDGDTWRIRSLGPNAAEDFACDAGSKGSSLGDPDTVIARLGIDTKAVEYTEDGDRIVGDDDMCTDIVFIGGGKESIWE